MKKMRRDILLMPKQQRRLLADLEAKGAIQQKRKCTNKSKRPVRMFYICPIQLHEMIATYLTKRFEFERRRRNRQIKKAQLILEDDDGN